jgi:hypothetical protein
MIMPLNSTQEARLAEINEALRADFSKAKVLQPAERAALRSEMSGLVGEQARPAAAADPARQALLAARANAFENVLADFRWSTTDRMLVAHALSDTLAAMPGEYTPGAREVRPQSALPAAVLPVTLANRLGDRSLTGDAREHVIGELHQVFSDTPPPGGGGR